MANGPNIFSNASCLSQFNFFTFIGLLNAIEISQTKKTLISRPTFLARNVIYTYRAYAMMPVRLSVCL